MRWSILFVLCYVMFCDALEDAIEERGKKKKIGLLIYFLDLVIKKVFILKLIYAFAFWILLHKAGYIFSWFISYVKDQKHEYYHDHGHGHHHIEYGPPGPYRRKSQKPYNPYSEPIRNLNPY